MQEYRKEKGSHPGCPVKRMKKIVYVCLKKEVAEDIELTSIMRQDLNYEVHAFYSPDSVLTDIKGLNPDLVIISYDALKERDEWNIKDIPVAYIAKNEQELQDGARYGYPTVGIAASIPEILDCIAKKPYKISPSAPAQQESVKQKPESQKMTAKQPNKQVNQKPKSKSTPVNVTDSGLESLDTLDEDEDLMEDFYTTESAQDPEPEYFNETEADDEYPDPFEGMDLDQDTEYEEVQEEGPEEDMEEDAEEVSVSTSVPETPKKKMQQKATGGQHKMAERIPSSQVPKKTKSADTIQEGFKKDTGKVKTKTQVITVYSAKGGVGKTTISSELATYLALVNIGKRKLRVCLVDYNIDFGDVSATIQIENDGNTIADWAAEVQELLEQGKPQEDIQYSKQEIEQWLQVEKKSGLYVLPAPATNEDSMGVESDALSVILDNIVQNGNFDYVICDTGNNTRDSTMIALEHATMILLIMTQNVNTANCDKSFIETMKSIDFDLSHTKLIINSIMPQKATSVSVQEIVEFFPNYECIGKLKFSTDVIKAGNLGEPLAFQADHEFTKQLRNIVSYILQDGNFQTDIDKINEKKGLFGFLFRKKVGRL